MYTWEVPGASHKGRHAERHQDISYTEEYSVVFICPSSAVWVRNLKQVTAEPSHVPFDVSLSLFQHGNSPLIIKYK